MAEPPQEDEGNAGAPNDEPFPGAGPSLLQIEDETAWFRQYGLTGEPHYGCESYLNRLEARERVESEKEYQEQVHAKVFSNDDDNANKRKQEQLKQWETETLLVQTATETLELNLKVVASMSDTVFAMASSRPYLKQRRQRRTDDNERYDESHHDEDDDAMEAPVSLSLSDYSTECVTSFMRLLDAFSKHTSKDERATFWNDNKLLPKTNEHFLVDYCGLANYLQCTDFLESIIPILIDSIDSENCLSLCQFADQLQLPSLLEAALNFVFQHFQSLRPNNNNDDDDDDNDGCNEESNHDNLWEDLSPELQDRITSMYSLLQSSNRRTLYFASFTEYLAVFAEQVEYYQERLSDAKHQQQRLLQSRNGDEETWGFQYAQDKIRKQERRVQSLKLLYQEHKRIFRNRDIQ